MMSLLQIPQSIWRENIAFFFSAVEELVRLDSAVVNKSDRKVFLSNISGCKRFFRMENKQHSIRWLVSRNIIVKKVTFSFELQLEDIPHFPKLLEPVTCIEFLQDSLRLFDNTKLQTVWLCSNQLVDLIFEGCKVEDISAISVCANLNFLQLVDCAYVSNESFVLGIVGCVRLDVFMLRRCANLRADALVALLQACAELKRVSLHGTFDLDMVFQQVTTATSITSFHCTDQVSVLSGSTMRDITVVMPELECFHLQYTHNTIADHDFAVLVQNCRNLADLILYKCTFVTNLSLVGTPECSSKLRRLYIEYCSSITDAGVISLIRFAINLCTLRMIGLSVSDAAIQAVGTYCPRLAELAVTHCTALTDSAFTTLNMSNLWYLDVTGTRVTGTFAAHVFQKGSALKNLLALHCAHLNADLVHALPERHARLSLLRLGAVNRLTESDWLQLSTKFPNLHSLRICDSVAVNDVVAQSFKSNCPKLRSVTLTGCSVSEDVLNLFT